MMSGAPEGVPEGGHAARRRKDAENAAKLALCYRIINRRDSEIGPGFR